MGVRSTRVFLVLLVMIVAACGGGDGLSDEEQALADEVAGAIAAALPPGSPFGAPEIGCMWEQAVGDFGVERFAGSGLEVGVFDSPQAGSEALAVFLGSLSQEEAEQLAEAGMACMDVRGMIIDEMISVGVRQDGAECFADELIDTAEPGFFFSVLGVPARAAEEVNTVMADAATKCLTPEEVEMLGGLP